MGVRRGGQGGGAVAPPPWILGQGVSRRALFVNSCQLQSLQLPAAQKQGYFSAFVAWIFKFFSRSRAKRPKKLLFQAGAREKWSIFVIYHIFTNIMHSYMLKISHENKNVHIYVFNFLLAPPWKKFCGRPWLSQHFLEAHRNGIHCLHSR